MDRKEPISLVRVYLTEKDGLVTKLLKVLKEEYEIHGVTVLRGVEGFGEHSKLHSSSLLALSLDLPLVLEFYASPEKADQVARTITDRYELRHVISLPGHWFSPAPSGDV
mgnify:CR=1 FL=1